MGECTPTLAMANPEKAFGCHLEAGTSLFTFAVVTLGVFGDGVDLHDIADKTYR